MLVAYTSYYTKMLVVRENNANGGKGTGRSGATQTVAAELSACAEYDAEDLRSETTTMATETSGVI